MNTENRFGNFLKGKAGYAASFVLGIVVMALTTTQLSPYTVARWMNTYEYAIFGSLIASDKTALKTGQIPQDILDWYDTNKRK